MQSATTDKAARGKVQVHAIVRRNLELRCLVLRRTPAKGRVWQCVTGKLEPGEKPLDGALRELREETGLTQPTPMHYLYEFAFSNHGSQFHEFVFVAIVDDEQVVLSPEHDEFRWVKPVEADSLLAFESNKAGLRAAIEWCHGAT